MNPLPWGCEGPLGIWHFKGKSPGGKNYHGRVHLEPFAEGSETLLATWETSNEKLMGLGLLYNGQLLLSRVVGPLSNEDMPGIVWYTMAGNGDFDAVWSSGGTMGKIGTGTTRGGIPGSLPGVRKILYYSALGNALPPELDLEIQAKDTAFGLTWKDGADVVFDGVGLATSRGLCAAWSASQPPRTKTLLVFAAQSPNQALGTSAIQNETGLGQETWWRPEAKP